MRRLVPVLGLALVSVASACSSGSAAHGDASAVIDVSLPWPDACPPTTINEKGIGKPCTRGGNQCPSPLLCTCDPVLGSTLVGVPCFCTLATLSPHATNDPCTDSVPANYCGSGVTCCNVLTSGAYCTPNVCLINDACLVFVTADGGT
jgi:hypothetical protein